MTLWPNVNSKVPRKLTEAPSHRDARHCLELEVELKIPVIFHKVGEYPNASEGSETGKQSAERPRTAPAAAWFAHATAGPRVDI
jgi:hypothetical protein